MAEAALNEYAAMNVQPLFTLMVEKRASDLFMTPFSPVKIKIDGKIMAVNKLELTPKMIRQAAIELALHMGGRVGGGEVLP